MADTQTPGERIAARIIGDWGASGRASIAAAIDEVIAEAREEAKAEISLDLRRAMTQSGVRPVLGWSFPSLGASRPGQKGRNK